MNVLRLFRKDIQFESINQHLFQERNWKRSWKQIDLHLQSWYFIVITEHSKREKLAQSPYAKFLKEVSVVIVWFGNQKVSLRRFIVDIAIAMQNTVLTAVDDGLSACWIYSFNEREVMDLLKNSRRASYSNSPCSRRSQREDWYLG